MRSEYWEGDNMPKVSVIVPVYNTDRYLRSCIESLINQTIDDIEIILIDDCSTDQSPIILEEYQRQYPLKIKVFRNSQNMGQGYTRNIGIKNALGEYIGFVDSDDYINPRMYQDMYQEAISNNYPEIISTGIRFVKDDRYLETDLSYVARRRGKIYNILDNNFIISDDSPSSCNKLFRRDYIKNQRFLEDTMWEDFSFTYTSLCNCNRILRINNADYFYRKRIDSGVSSKGFIPNSHLFDCFKVADEIETQTRKTGRYELLKEEIEFLQVAVCLERVVEVFNWNIDTERKDKLCFYITNLVNNKYGNIKNIAMEKLSSIIGILELNKIKSILEKYKNSSTTITIPKIKELSKGKTL